MRNRPVPSGSSRWHRWITIAFVVYAVILVISVRRISHFLWAGWPARLGTMGGIALGVFPWAAWLRPRVERVLDLIGRGVLLVCYLSLIAPFAMLARCVRGSLQMRSPASSSQWCKRKPSPETLDAARLEW